IFDGSAAGVDFTNASLRFTTLVSTSMPNSTLRGADAFFVEFSQDDLGGADLSGADLSAAGFHNSIFTNANMRATRLRFVVFGSSPRPEGYEGPFIDRTSLDDSDFTGADIRFAAIDSIDAHGAIFDNARFDGSEFSDPAIAG